MQLGADENSAPAGQGDAALADSSPTDAVRRSSAAGDAAALQEAPAVPDTEEQTDMTKVSSGVAADSAAVAAKEPAASDGAQPEAGEASARATDQVALSGADETGQPSSAEEPAAAARSFPVHAWVLVLKGKREVWGTACHAAAGIH